MIHSATEIEVKHGHPRMAARRGESKSRPTTPQSGVKRRLNGPARSPGAGLFGLVWLLVTIVVGACVGEPDARTVEGALAKAATALARNDASGLFRVIDQRARHALAAIVQARHEAAEIIRKSYPAGEQERALGELGDALGAKDAAALFALRCPQTCRDELAARVGAPADVKSDGPVTIVRTARGSELRLFHGTDTWYGIEWQTEAVSRERDRAAAELDLVRKNGELYAQQNALHQ
jgi:hypothetical protein